MFLVDEKIGAAAVDEEEDEVAMVIWRLAGGAVGALLVPFVCSDPFVLAGGAVGALLVPFVCSDPFPGFVDIFFKRGLVVVLEFRTHFLLS